MRLELSALDNNQIEGRVMEDYVIQMDDLPPARTLRRDVMPYAHIPYFYAKTFSVADAWISIFGRLASKQ